MKRFWFFTALIGLALATRLLAGPKEFPFEDFKPSTLRAAAGADAKAAENSPTPESRLILSKPPLQHRTATTFSGETRPLSHDKQELIERWALLQKASRTFATSFEEEFLFVENGRKFWMPVQKQLVPPLRREVVKDHEVELYYFSGIGGLRNESGWDWIFLVAEFQVKK